MQEEIKKYLLRIGFTDTEALVYLCGMRKQEFGAQELSKETGIKRTTVYAALDALTKQGMVSKKLKGGKTKFVTAPLSLIEQQLDQKISSIEDQKLELFNILPLLDDLLLEDRKRSIVSEFEGVEGMKSVVTEALYCNEREWKIIAPAKNFFSELDKEYARQFIKTREERNIHARSLWERSFVEKRKFSEVSVSMRDPRILPQDFEGKFKSTMILFDDQVAILSSLKEKFAVLIQSEEMHQMLSILFDGIWNNSKPIPKKFMKK